MTTSVRWPLEGSRCLVTGGAGLVGSHIVDALAERSVAEIVVLDSLVRGDESRLAAAERRTPVRFVRGDIRDADLVRESTVGVDYVFHQAAMWLRQSEQSPRESLDVNVIGTFNVLEAAADAGVKKVVAASSSSVYGDGDYLPTDEGHPFNNYLFYGAGKVAGEQLLRSFYKARALDYVGLRYLNVYGPRQSAGAAYMDVIMAFADRIEAGLAPRIEGDGSQTLDMVFVADAARANLIALEADVTNEMFNVASGAETTVATLAETMLQIYGRSDLEPEFVPRDQKLVSRRWGSAGKAEAMLGFRTEIGIEEGLRRVVEARRAAGLTPQPA